MLYVVFAVLIAVLDQVFKHWITSVLATGGQIDLIPGILHLTYVENRGMAFGFMNEANTRWILLGITAVCVVIVIILMVKCRRMGTGTMLALSAVLGGALGNAVDRLLLGYVVDMFELEFIYFPVFNIGDCFITVGAILFVLCYLVHAHKEKKCRQLEAATAEDVPESERVPDDLLPEEKEWTEFEILHEYELEKMMREQSEHDKENHD
jgi:signal peptidase II